MEKRYVSFAVRAKFLNIIYMSFGFKGLKKFVVKCKMCLKQMENCPTRSV
jgi:hypothetical protein